MYAFFVLFAVAASALKLQARDEPDPELVEIKTEEDKIQIQQMVEIGKSILKEPFALERNSNSGQFRPRIGRVLSPRLFDIPPLQHPEDYFEQVLLPRVPADKGRQYIIDVGANEGQFATPMSKAGIDGVSFEPDPKVCKKLEENMNRVNKEHTGQQTVYCAAVGDKPGSVTFEVSGASQSSKMVLDGKTEGKDVIDVPVLTLDSVVPSDKNVLLLKTDTQGFEMGVLRGAHQLLKDKAPRLLMIEMSNGLLRNAGSSPMELMLHTQSYGYVCTHFTYHGFTHTDEEGKHHFGQWEEDSYDKDGSMTFETMAEILKAMPKTGKSGWTDLFCW